MRKAMLGAALMLFLISPFAISETLGVKEKQAHTKEYFLTHVVQKGQNLWQIAHWYGSNPKEIKALNRLSKNAIFPKQKLIILSKPHVITASWYGPGFHGRPMASGKIFLQQEIVAAHKRLPLGSRVRLVNPKTGTVLIVPILDRGPYILGREYDLSKGTAEALGTINPGVARLVVQVISTPH